MRDLLYVETWFLLDPLVPCAYLVKGWLDGALYILYSYLHKLHSPVAWQHLEFDRCCDSYGCSRSLSVHLSSYKVFQPLLGKEEPGGSLVPGPDVHEENTSTNRCSPLHFSLAPWWCHPCEKPAHLQFRPCCHRELWHTGSEGNRRQKIWDISPLRQVLVRRRHVMTMTHNEEAPRMAVLSWNWLWINNGLVWQG